MTLRGGIIELMGGFAGLRFGQGLIGGECFIRGFGLGEVLIVFSFPEIVDMVSESFEWGLVTDLDVPLDGLRRNSIPHSPQRYLCLTTLQQCVLLHGANRSTSSTCTNVKLQYSGCDTNLSK